MLSTLQENDIHDYMKETALAVDEYTKSFLDSFTKQSVPFASLLYLVDRRFGRPKLRSTLGRAMYESLGGQKWQELVPLLAFMELSTLSTYVLDDIIDDQLERDGMPATHTKFGVSEGIIGGSQQAFIALQMLEKVAVDDAVKSRLLQAGIAMWVILWTGEERNETMKIGTTKEEYILRCYELCGVMFEATAKMAAIIAGVPEDKILYYSQIGKIFGTGVMIRNDVTCFLPEKFMKDRSRALSRRSFEDVRKGLWTYPFISAAQVNNQELKQMLQEVVGAKDLPESKYIALSEKLMEFGCIHQTLELIEDYQKETRRLLSKMPPHPYLSMLVDMQSNMNKYFEDFSEQTKIQKV